MHPLMLIYMGSFGSQFHTKKKEVCKDGGFVLTPQNLDHVNLYFSIMIASYLASNFSFFWLNLAFY